MEQIPILLRYFISTILPHIFKIIIAFIFLWIGFKIIKKLTRIQFKLLDRNSIDGTVNNYLNHISQISLKIILIIVLLGFIGISQTTLAALLGASILAIGLSLKGSLANIAGGVVILLFRPFKLGDIIRTPEGNGKVESISLFYTLIITDDNKVIYVPNGKLSSSSIINLSTKDLRRVDLDVLVSASENTDKVKEILNSLITNSPLIFPNSNIFYGVISQSGSTTTYGIRVWCKADDYSLLNSLLLDKISKLFDNGLITPP